MIELFILLQFIQDLTPGSNLLIFYEEQNEVGVRTSISHKAKKKICVFMVRRPTLIFGPDPKLFNGTFSRKLFKCPIFAFQCSF